MKKIVSALFAVLMVAFASIPAFAADTDVISPVATTAPATTFRYEVDAIPSEGGSGSYEFKTDIDEDGNQVVHIKPNPNPGYVFDHWDIDGSYTTDNKLTDEEMDLVISSDIKVTPYFKKTGSSVVETGTVNRDGNTTSPKTGANDVLPYAVIMLSIAACGAAVVMLVRTNKGK